MWDGVGVIGDGRGYGGFDPRNSPAPRPGAFQMLVVVVVAA